MEFKRMVLLNNHDQRTDGFITVADMLRLFCPDSFAENAPVGPLVADQSAAPAAPFTDMDGGGGVVSTDDIGRAFIALVSRARATARDDSRIPSPGVIPPVQPPPAKIVEPAIEPVRLGDLFAAYYRRAKTTKTESSWSGYRSLIRKWTASHGGHGPDVREITESVLQSFFESRVEWNSERSWCRNRDLLFAVLKSGCQRTTTNKGGSDSPVLKIESLPLWELPPGRWFRDRPAPETTRGGHRKRTLELLTVDEFNRIMAACSVATWKAAAWWRAWFGLVFFCGPRFEDSFRYAWNSGSLHINRQRKLIDFTETKCGGASGVPLPDSLAAALDELWIPSRDGKPIFTGSRDTLLTATRGQLANRSRRFDPEYDQIFQAAGVEKRHPHELRSVCVSWWLQHAPEYRKVITGHSAGNDVQMSNYVILDEKFRRTCNAYPLLWRGDDGLKNVETA